MDGWLADWLAGWLAMHEHLSSASTYVPVSARINSLAHSLTHSHHSHHIISYYILLVPVDVRQSEWVIVWLIDWSYGLLAPSKQQQHCSLITYLNTARPTDVCTVLYNLLFLVFANKKDACNQSCFGWVWWVTGLLHIYLWVQRGQDRKKVVRIVFCCQHRIRHLKSLLSRLFPPHITSYCLSHSLFAAKPADVTLR